MFTESNLHYHCINVRICSTEEVAFNAWIGAVIRNNLLYAANNIAISENQSLLQYIEHNPLPQHSPMYKQFEGGFPQGYLLSLNSHNCAHNPVQTIGKGEVLCFSIYLIGKYTDLAESFIHAIVAMCKRGMGHPPMPFFVIDIMEESTSGSCNLLYAGERFISSNLIHPLSINNFNPYHTENFAINFTTPLNLYKQKQKTNSSYQSKMNGFPSFYQLVRSAIFRYSHLCTLYSKNYTDKYDFDQYLSAASDITLLSAQIQQITLQSTPRKDDSRQILFKGFVGELIFSGDIFDYLPLLLFMQALGVGDNIVYGLGRYKTEIL